MVKISELKSSKNIAELLKESQLAEIADQVLNGYRVDKDSRSEWEEVIDKAMKIAKQTWEKKNTPWENASNIKYPLITKGGIDFAARMLPEIIRKDQIVKISTMGKDPNDLIYKRAVRVQKHMEYQLLKQSDDWIDGMDGLLHVLPVLGTVFKKTFYDPIAKKPISQLCMPDKIVVNYNTESLEKARRITHEFTFYKNDVLSRMRSGLYIEDDMDKLLCDEGYSDDTYDPPIEMLEQHCWLDLDEDGFPEPYIVILHKSSQKVLRIVNRFKEIEKNKKGEIKHIEPKHYFTDYHFIRSPDGGFYSIGFGTMLYPLNEAINTIFNQLVDSGTLHNLQSGFMGKGFRLKSGEFYMSPGEWKFVDTPTGTSIADNVYALPTKEPSSVLFQLLGLLLEIGKDLTSTNDAMEGSQPAQNVPATTILTLVEQGMKVYSAITNRIFRGLKKELQKIYELNKDHLTDEEYRRVLNIPNAVVADDYEIESCDIMPVADPNMASDAQRMAKAQALTSVPGLDPQVVTRYYLESLQIDEELIQKLMPKPDPNAAPPAEQMKLMAEVEKLKAQAQSLQAQAQLLAEKNKIEAAKLEIQKQDSMAYNRESEKRGLKMEKDIEVNEAKIQIAGAKADHEARMSELKMAQDQQVAETEMTIKAMNALVGAESLKIDEKKVENDAKKITQGNKSKK